MTLEKRVFSILGELEGTVGMYFQDLGTGKTISINPNTEFSAASTIKIPLISLLLIQSKSGLINLKGQVEIDRANRVGGTGVIKELDRSFKPTILDLAKLAIIVSDNIATNQLIDIVGGPESVTEFCNKLGLNNTKLQRKMMDIEAMKSGRDNITTAGDMGYLLKLLANNQIDSEEVSGSVVNIMKGQQLRQKLPYLIPALEPDDPNVYSDKVENGTVVVAHKTGDLWKVQHDVGIFMLPEGRKYVLAVYTSNLKSDDEGIRAIAKLSKEVYDAMVCDN
jgi:beta-lactamase class A